MTGFIAKLRNAFRLHRESAAARLLAGGSSISYEDARELARHSDPEIRRQLASRPDVQPEILYYLAEDPVPAVRREIAGNRASPVQADLCLAADADPAVRGDLAQKIARLAPGLSASEVDRLRRMTFEALQILARDQMTRVRQILAEALRDVANVPPELVRRLAHDSELVVASPVLEFSPVLTDEDLLEIIHSCPIDGALSAISRRATVGGDVCDAISRTEDTNAIAVLLANPSAQIREETLDLLLERAPSHEVWHGPLVGRPQLPARAAIRLARFVADSLLDALQKRDDLDDDTKATVAAVVRRRIEENGSNNADRHGADQPERPAQDADAQWQAALRLYQAGSLDESTVQAALADHNHEFVISALALKAVVSKRRAEKIFATQSAKGAVALVWKAGFSMALAVTLQTRLSRLAPADVLRPRQGTQGFPLTADEMNWQMELFASLVGDDDDHETDGSPAETRVG